MGSSGVRTDLADFVHGRTAELHRTAYLLTADQNHAEHLVAAALRTITRHTDLNQAGTTLRHTMAHLAASADTPTTPDPTRAPRDPSQHTLATLTPRQRAILTLRTIDGLPTRDIAKVLGLSTRVVGASEGQAMTALGNAMDGGQLRILLDDFGEHATWPDPHETLEAVGDGRRRPAVGVRPRWTYLAAVVVVALSVTSVTVSHTHHEDWLHSPAGINATHGTHFAEYSTGYQLAGVQTLRPGARLKLALQWNEVGLLGCSDAKTSETEQFESHVGLTSSDQDSDNVPCSRQRDGLSDLGPTTDAVGTLVAPKKTHSWPVAIYRKLSWSEYPVARGDFTIAARPALSDLLPTSDGKTKLRAVSTTKVLTLTSGARVNGTFTARFTLPKAVSGTNLVIAGILRPTTTGRFGATLAGTGLFESCGALDPASDTHCDVFDRRITPSILGSFGMPDYDVIPDGGRTGTVRITVHDASGPWRVQLMAARYKVDKDGNPVDP